MADDIAARAAAAKANMAQPASAGITGDASAAKEVFHNSFPGSTFVMPDGSILNFDYRGELETEDPRIIAELKAIADKPGSPVYYKKAAATPAPGDKTPVEDIQSKAAATMAQLIAQQNRQGV